MSDRSGQKYLEKCQPDPSGPFGIKAEVLDTFVKSCGAFCVAFFCSSTVADVER